MNFQRLTVIEEQNTTAMSQEDKEFTHNCHHKLLCADFARINYNSADKSFKMNNRIVKSVCIIGQVVFRKHNKKGYQYLVEDGTSTVHVYQSDNLTIGMDKIDNRVLLQELMSDRNRTADIDVLIQELFNECYVTKEYLDLGDYAMFVGNIGRAFNLDDIIQMILFSNNTIYIPNNHTKILYNHFMECMNNRASETNE